MGWGRGGGLFVLVIFAFLAAVVLNCRCSSDLSPAQQTMCTVPDLATVYISGKGLRPDRSV